MYTLKPYDDALHQILETGVKKTNRTGVGTIAVFGIQSRYNLQQGFPLLTGREIPHKAVFAELLWFLSGSTNNKDLQQLGTNIWTPWVDAEFEKKHGYAEGAFGPVYGFQLRHFNGEYGNGIGGKVGTQDKTVWETMECNSGGAVWDEETDLGSNYGRGGFDQLDWMVNRIKTAPDCRRILFSLWNPLQTDKMRLPPCHYTYQVFIDPDKGNLSGMLTQRSCDFPIGVPFNIAFYSALTMLLAQQTGYTPFEFVHSTVDSHIYLNQMQAVEEYLKRPKPDSPKLFIEKAADIYSYNLDSFQLVGYKPQPKIKIPVAV